MCAQRKNKPIDLLTLAPDTDVEVLINQLVRQEALVTDTRKPQLRKLVYKLIEKQESHENQSFYLFKILRAHILPLTNCAFNKSGDRFITGSYDRTCKVGSTLFTPSLSTRPLFTPPPSTPSLSTPCQVWTTLTGEELLTLEGHKTVVYAIAFNNPFGDKIVTGSFDKTAKLWDAQTGVLLHTFRGAPT